MEDCTRGVTRERLREMQAWPLEKKIAVSECRIGEWYDMWDGQVVVSFSGGKDSTVLLDIVRGLYPKVPALFSDTGLEFPEIKAFVRQQENVEIVRPKRSFREVIAEFGYPVVSKLVARYVSDLQNPTPENEATRHLRLTGMTRDGVYSATMKLSDKWRYLVDAPFKVSSSCCRHLKKEPLHRHGRETGLKPITAQMAEEGGARAATYLQYGCNIYRARYPISHPLGFWTEQDVLQYLVERELPYASVYGEIVKDDTGGWMTTGERRTGCIYCMFGVHLEEEPNRFQRLRKTHPKLYRYCIEELGIGEVLDYIGVPYETDPPPQYEQIPLFTHRR